MSVTHGHPVRVRTQLAILSTSAAQFEDVLAIHDHAIVDAVLAAFQRTLPASTWLALDLPSVRAVHLEDPGSNVEFNFMNVGGKLEVEGKVLLYCGTGHRYLFAETRSEADRYLIATYAGFDEGVDLRLGSADGFGDWLTLTVQALGLGETAIPHDAPN